MNESDFLAAIRARPEDDAPKLAYADQLEERGDDRSRFILAVIDGVKGREATPEDICRAAGIDWIADDYRRTIRETALHLELWRHFAADCAEQSLLIFEREHPGDDRPRSAVKSARTASNYASARADVAFKAGALADQVFRVGPPAARAAAHAARAAHAANVAHASRAANARIAGMSLDASVAPLNPRAVDVDRASSEAAFAAFAAAQVFNHSEPVLRWQLVRLGEYKLWRRALGLHRTQFESWDSQPLRAAASRLPPSQ
ncbi:MAG: TIGR02996 domain-containing protein [Planctomycetales bacterium]